MITEKDLFKDIRGRICFESKGETMLISGTRDNGVFFQVWNPLHGPLKPLVTDVMRSYADQPFCFGEKFQVSDGDGRWHDRRFGFKSSAPHIDCRFTTMDSDQYKLAQRIETVTIDGEEISKHEAEERYRKLGEALGK